MPYERTIVCLANSNRPGGHCVAGRVVEGGRVWQWVRPVSSRATHEVSYEERCYDNHKDVQLLDLVRIQFIHPAPEGYQTENELFDARVKWEYCGVLSWNALQAGVETVVGPLWRNRDSSVHGVNDRVAAEEARDFERSLYLVRPEGFRIEVGEEGGGDLRKRRRVRGLFELGGHPYRLSVTDPRMIREYFSRSLGEYALKDVLLCISLGEAFDHHAYKLVAAVILPPRRRPS